MIASATVAITQGRCVRSIRILSGSPGFGGERRPHPAEEFVRLHAMRRVVRAGIHAAGLGQVRTQIARSRLLLYDGYLPPNVHRIIFEYRERMHIDISIRAVFLAQAASDAPILDDHFG